MAYLQINFFSAALNRNTTVHAVIPINNRSGPFAISDDLQPMKALYLLHGFTGDEMDWLQFSRIRQLSDQYNVAVFMPGGTNSFYLDDEDKGELVGEFVGEELVAYTRKLFPLSTEREHTWIGGLSMGGFGAIRNGLKYAETFGRIIALSSAIVTYRIAGKTEGTVDGFSIQYFKRVFGDLGQLMGSDRDPETLVRRLLEKGACPPNIYMTCGTEDFLLDVNRRFCDFLEQKNVPFTYYETTGSHTWEFWDATIELGLQWATEYKQEQKADQT